ncbi:YhfH family protein [Sporosarcina sp. ANT_H38]
MGEYAEMTLEGEFCEGCGEYIGDGNGYPQRCAGCHSEITTAELEKEIGRGKHFGTSN